MARYLKWYLSKKVAQVAGIRGQGRLSLPKQLACCLWSEPPPKGVPSRGPTYTLARGPTPEVAASGLSILGLSLLLTLLVELF